MDRGRRMTPTECMRIQGISSRAVAGLPASFIRSCVGNAMSVRVVSMLVDAAFKVMAPFEQSPRVVAAPASVETSRIRGVSTPVTTVHRRPFLPKKPKFSKEYFIVDVSVRKYKAIREDARRDHQKLRYISDDLFDEILY